jgi:flagellar export protein FliJ
MKTPYEALYTVRRIEEREAEGLLARCRDELARSQSELGATRSGRLAWLEEYLEGPTDDSRGVPALIARIERAERAAEARLEVAAETEESARQAFLERRRHREAIERLHQDALARIALAAARREQSELDDLAGIGAQRRRAEATGNS